MMSLSFYEISFRLLLALILGVSLGIERVRAGKMAGVRTFALVAIGSAFAIIISEQVITKYILLHLEGNVFRFDPLRLMAGLIQGIGFIGAGMIIFQKDHIANLTTAAGVWTASVIGMAVGFGLYLESIFATILIIFTFTIMLRFEEYIRSFFVLDKDQHQGSNLSNK